MVPQGRSAASDKTRPAALRWQRWHLLHSSHGTQLSVVARQGECSTDGVVCKRRQFQLLELLRPETRHELRNAKIECL